MSRRIKVGDVLDSKYRVERVIGVGGVGIVVAAVHKTLGNPVAIKVLRSDDKDMRERFMREARAAVRLHGDHVAHVSDVGTLKDGSPYMVMELLVGEDLGQLLTRGPLPIETAVELVLQVCEGLAEAHALGIIHRDVKPRNLFLTNRVNRGPLLKLLDFGLAKNLTAVDDKALTQSSMVMGSPQYMSPEQLRATRDVDVRTDVWSLGICLYELLTGAPPFDAPTIPDLFAKILTLAPVPAHEKRPEIPVALWDVIARCLSREREDRYGNIHELAIALEPFAPQSRGVADRVLAVLHAPPQELLPDQGLQGSHDIGTQTAATFDSVRERSPNRIVVGIGVFASVLVIGLLVFMVRRTPTPASPPPSDPEPKSTAIAPVIVTAAPTDPPVAPSASVSSPAKTQKPPAVVKPSAPPTRSLDAGISPSKVF